MKKTALIFGITGQDGSYLAEFLLKKNYIIHGVKRRSSSANTERIDHLFDSLNFSNKNFFIHYGDISDGTNTLDIINKVRPDEIYNLAAQSHVRVSFDIPEYTADITALGALRILEAIRILKLKKVKYYQASSSEMFGLVKKRKSLNEKTPFHPRSIYGVSKVFAYHSTVHYREAYGLFACNGILFNHESPRRGPTFVTKKISTTFFGYGWYMNRYEMIEPIREMRKNESMLNLDLSKKKPYQSSAIIALLVDTGFVGVFLFLVNLLYGFFEILKTSNKIKYIIGIAYLSILFWSFVGTITPLLLFYFWVMPNNPIILMLEKKR